MSTDTSPNWKKNKKLPFIKTGLHDGFPFSEGFPPRSHDSTFELVTSYGEIIKGATVGNHNAFNAATNPPYWDISRCKFGRQSRAGRFKRLDEGHVAGWKRED